MGWNYCMQWLTVLPLEIIAASITIKFWEEDPNFKHATYVAIFLVLVVGINMFGVKG
jgi:amino acid transporter